MKNNWDTIIIGAGPKGLAMKLKLEKAGIDACILEKHNQAGNTWSPEFMDPMMPITNDIEVTDERDFTFKNWYMSLSPEEISKYSTRFNLMTAKHYFDYIQVFAKRLSDVYYGVSVTKIDVKPSGRIKIKCNNDFFYCKHLIIASGMAGYGGQEFSRNNLYAKLIKEKLVAHTPDNIRTRADYLDFIGDSKEITLVGSGMSQVATLFVLPLLKSVEKIHFLSARSFHDNSDKLSLDYNREYSEAISTLCYDHRMIKYPFTNIVDIKQEEGKVLLEIEKSGRTENVKTDKVIFATGYSYKYTQLPFLYPILSGLETEKFGDEFFPKVDLFNRAYYKGKPSEIYFLGASTAKHDSKKRQLSTTLKDVDNIISGITSSRVLRISILQYLRQKFNYAV